MNVKVKRNLLNFFIMPCGLVGLSFLAHYSDLFIIVMILYFIVLAYASMNIKCPNCNYPLGLHKPDESIDFTSKKWSPFTKDKCAQCGKKF